MIAAACIYSAMIFRKQKGFDPGVDLEINGHHWYKWIDAAIELADINAVYSIIKTIYSPPKVAL